MSYRTFIDGTQIFGNNDFFEEWKEFIRSEGIEIDEDGCYEGEISNIMDMFDTIDKITRMLIKERHEDVLKGKTDFKGNPLKELTDLSGSIYLKDDVPLLMFGIEMVENAYCFLPYQVYTIVKTKIERVTGSYKKDGVDWQFYVYKLKEGEKIKVRAG